MLRTLQQEGVFAPLVPWSAEEVFSLAAESQVNDRKPYQGVTGKNTGLHPGATACNSTAALGVNWRQWSGTVPGATVTYDYDAFGNKVNSTGTTPNNYLYRGEELDTDLGLYYLRARYMNPMTGRFLSRDPEEFCDCSIRHPASLHKYLYGENDPVDLSDPSGRAADPLPLPEPPPQAKPVSTGLEYALLVGVISLTADHALPPLRNQINCMFDTEGSGLLAVSQYLGSPQDLLVDWATCSARSSKMPDTPPYGPYPAPFFPNENWATQPGNPWKCEANAEGWITQCRRRCPDGGEEWFTWDPGSKYGEPPHWDWHRCDNSTCKIYLDGSSTCPP